MPGELESLHYEVLLLEAEINRFEQILSKIEESSAELARVNSDLSRILRELSEGMRSLGQSVSNLAEGLGPLAELPEQKTFQSLSSDVSESLEKLSSLENRVEELIRKQNESGQSPREELGKVLAERLDTLSTAISETSQKISQLQEDIRNILNLLVIEARLKRVTKSV